jgi:AsmA protein
MRRLGIALAVVAALAVIAAGVVLWSFDSQKQRGILTSRLGAALGRKVTLGNLKLGLFPPSLYVRDAEIADALGFKDSVFSTAKTFGMRVRLMPLLHGRVEVPSIELDQPVIHLVKNARGQWNFASLGGTASQVQPSPAAPAAGESERLLDIEELRLRDGTITVDDYQKNTPRVTLDRISVTIRNFAPNRPFDWEVSVHPPGPDTGQVRASGRGGPLSTANLAASPVDGHVVFKNVALEALAPFTGQPGLAGLFGGEADFHSDGRKAAAKGTYQAEKLRLVPGGGTALAPLSGRFDVAMPEDASRLQVSQFDLTCGKATAHSAGQVTFGPRPETDIRASLSAAPLADIAKLFPLFGIRLPAGSSLTEGTLTAAVRAFGPSAALKQSGTIEIRNARLAGYNLAGQLGTALRLAGVDTGGRDTAIDSLSLTLDADQSYTRVPSASLLIPGMQINGQGGFSPAGAVDFRGTVALTHANLVGGLLSRATGGTSAVPFLVGGTLENPQIRPDVGKLVNQQLTQQLNKQPGDVPPADQLLKGLGGLFKKKK